MRFYYVRGFTPDKVYHITNEEYSISAGTLCGIDTHILNYREIEFFIKEEDFTGTNVCKKCLAKRIELLKDK